MMSAITSAITSLIFLAVGIEIHIYIVLKEINKLEKGDSNKKTMDVISILLL